MGIDDSDLLRLSIANPGEIPNFDNFYAPTIIPGSTGELSFDITNRYNFTTENTMSNVTLTINIYLFKTLEDKKDADKIKNGPKITAGNDALSDIPDISTAVYFWSEIMSNETVPVEVSIKSSSDTPQGTYFVRMHLNFSFNGTYFNMRSRGHFTNKQWENAQPNATDLEGYYNGKLIKGRLDLNALDVDGIIPDTSFRVKDPIPIWPLYLFVGGAILCLVLAGVFYLMDEKGKFPGTKKKLDNVSEKIEKLRYRRE